MLWGGGACGAACSLASGDFTSGPCHAATAWKETSGKKPGLTSHYSSNLEVTKSLFCKATWRTVPYCDPSMRHAHCSYNTTNCFTLAMRLQLYREHTWPHGLTASRPHGVGVTTSLGLDVPGAFCTDGDRAASDLCRFGHSKAMGI